MSDELLDDPEWLRELEFDSYRDASGMSTRTRLANNWYCEYRFALNCLSK